MGRIAGEEVEVGLSIASLAGPRGGSDREVEGRSCDAGAPSSPTRVKDVLVEESAPKAPVPGAVGSKPGAFNRFVGPSETSAMFKASFLASLLARGVAGSVLAVAVIVVNVVVVMVSVWEGKRSGAAGTGLVLIYIWIKQKFSKRRTVLPTTMTLQVSNSVAALPCRSELAGVFFSETSRPGLTHGPKYL